MKSAFENTDGIAEIREKKTELSTRGHYHKISLNKLYMYIF